MGVTSNASGIKAGTVAHFAASAAPSGWIKANGAAVSRTLYGALFNAIGTTYGVGDGSTTFNVPDLRGEFVRSLDDGRGVDSGRGLGTWQDSDNRNHLHGVNDPGHGHNLNGQTIQFGTATAPSAVTDGNARPLGTTTQAAGTGISIQANGGTEARPRNVAMLACIKF